MVRVRYEEGVATQLGPSRAFACEGADEASAGKRIGQPLSREKSSILGADAFQIAEGDTSRRATASARTAQRGRRPSHGDVSVKGKIDSRMSNTQWLFRHPRSEPDCTTWSFLARSTSHSVAVGGWLHQDPACGGRGSGERDHSGIRIFRPGIEPEAAIERVRAARPGAIEMPRKRNGSRTVRRDPEQPRHERFQP